MEAPKTIYLYPSDRAGEEYEEDWGDKPWGEGCIEYTRTDAFIEKACDWLKAHSPFVNDDILDVWLDNFKKVMKGE